MDLKLKEMLSKLAATALTFESGRKSATVDEVYFRKEGNIVAVSSTRNVTLTANTYASIGTVSADFRPSATRYIPMLLGGFANIVGLMRVTTAGDVSFVCSQNIQNYPIYLSAAYVI